MGTVTRQQQVGEAIGGRPALAGVPPEVTNRLADSCIRPHVLKASGTSNRPKDDSGPPLPSTHLSLAPSFP